MKLWQEVLNKISEKLPKASFEAWFANTIINVEDDTITVYASNSFAMEWMERRYDALVSETVEEITGETYNVKYSWSEELDAPSRPTYSNRDSLIHQLLERIEKLEDRVQHLEE